MITFTTARHAFDLVDSLEDGGRAIAHTSVYAGKTLYGVVHTYFALFQEMGQFGSGVKEIVDGSKKKPIDIQAVRGGTVADWRTELAALTELRGGLSSRQVHGLHGAAIMGGGFLGACEALHQYGKIDLGVWRPFVEVTGASLFFVGNMVSVYDCASKLHSALILFDEGGEEGAVARKAARAAALGLISGLSYLLLEAVVLFGAPQALAIVIGAIGAATGCLRWLYEYFVISKAWDELAE